MALSNYQGVRTAQGQSLISGRGFAVADPERQREIDLDQVRAFSRLGDPSLSSGNRPAPCGWMSAARDPGDEGGSVRRFTR